MALFGMEMKRRHKKLGGFHAEYIDKRIDKKRKSMGLGRTLGSATSLIIGGTMCYVALHYIPAYLGLNKVLSLSDLNTSSSVAPEDSQWASLTSYVDAFRIKRTYLRQGQEIQAEYALPEGATLDLIIQRCQPAFIVEIFKCQVISEETAQVKNNKVGAQRFHFPEAGFYRFDEKVTLAPDNVKNYRVIWSRA